MTTLRRYTDLRAWLRHLGKSSVHAGTGALMSGAGTHTLQGVAPETFPQIGLTLEQMIAVFVAAAFFEAIKRIHAITAETRPPIP